MCLVSRTTADGYVEQSEGQHFCSPGQRDDIPRLDRHAAFFDAAAVETDMPRLGPALRQGPALGKAQEEQQLVDAQRSAFAELALQGRKLQRER